MNEMINNYQIVVARYNENISWLNKFKNITLVYNKGNYDKCLNDFNVISLPNFGRESHTFLYHIINNYDNLKEYTIFFQGSLKFDKNIKHNALNIENYFQINDFNATLQKVDFDLFKHPIKHFGKWKREQDSGIMKKSYFTCYSWLKNFMDFDDSNINYINVAWGAIFSIHKSVILRKPKIFYEHLIRFIDYHPNPEEGHFFERSWHFIFHNKHLEKKIIKVIKNKDKNINLQKLSTKDNNFHLWINNNYYNKNFHKINDLIIYPHYYFQINKHTFSFTFTDIFYIKIKINDDNYFQLVLSSQQDFNIVLLNNNIITKVKNNLNNYLNDLNFIVELNTIKIYINNELYFKYNLDDIKDIQFNNVDDILIFVKSTSYSNNIVFNKNKDNIKFITLINDYYDIRSFYKTYFLENYIDLDNF